MFESPYSGFLGLLPYTNQADTSGNFLNQLKKQGVIDNEVFSIFVDTAHGNYSSIKFGSYDRHGLEKDTPLGMVKTKSTKTWEVQILHYDIEKQQPTTSTIIFEPQLPFLYIPHNDHTEIKYFYMK